MTRLVPLVLLLLVIVIAGSCDLVDPMRATPQPDSETFGNLLEAAPDPARPGTWVARIRVAVPRALGRTADAQPTPDVAGGIIAVVTVTADTVVVVDDEPAALMDIGPGSEVVAVPLAGTTTMRGESEIHLVADYMMDFESYARWRMPKLELAAADIPLVEDPALVNSSGVETAPIPVGDGHALYFTARLRPPGLAGGAWIGARRDGLPEPVEGERSYNRVYRTGLGADGWSAPEPVDFPEIAADQHVKLTWISADELSCYVTVSDDAGEPWIGISHRDAVGDSWSGLVRAEVTGVGDAFDGVAMAGKSDAILFGTTRTGGGDIYLYDPDIGQARPLQPEINTGGLEWAPRVGPAGELYFLRGNRQLRFHSGSVEEVRLPGPHRTLITEAAPTADGAWLFFATPRFRPVEFDFDIQVAALSEDGSPGQPVPVDEWRPE